MHYLEGKSLWLAVCGVGAGVLAMSLFLAAPKLREMGAERNCGRRHLFAISNQFSFLPDAVAIEKALEAVLAQGFDTNKWKPETYSQTKAPDGTLDRYLCRNAVDDYQGLIKLTNSMGRYRYVQVTLVTNAVECVVHGKRSPSPTRL